MVCSSSGLPTTKRLCEDHERQTPVESYDSYEGGEGYEENDESQEGNEGDESEGEEVIYHVVKKSAFSFSSR